MNPHRFLWDDNKIEERGIIPANTGHCSCVGSMLGQRRRRWTNIEPTHEQCPVFAGMRLFYVGMNSMEHTLRSHKEKTIWTCKTSYIRDQKQYHDSRNTLKHAVISLLFTPTYFMY